MLSTDVYINNEHSITTNWALIVIGLAFVTHRSMNLFESSMIHSPYSQKGSSANCPPFDPYHSARVQNNITALHMAAKCGRTEMVKLLLGASALVDCQTRDGLTPLHCAARSGHADLVNVLVDAGASPSAATRVSYELVGGHFPLPAKCATRH